MFATKRLGKELQKAKQKLPPGIDLVKADDFREWQMDIRVLDANPIYEGKIFRLCFLFSSNYPIGNELTFSPAAALTPEIEAPEVTFVKIEPPSSTPIDLTSSSPSPSEPSSRPIPIHPHIYSNGIICLDLLGTAGWSPVQSVESVCMSIQSMLTGNTKNEKPPGDEEFCRSMGARGVNGWGGGRIGRGLKDVRFVYDDNTV